MNFREMLEKACKGYTTKREFYAAIGQHENAVIDAKKGKRGLPDTACVKLAQILDIDFGKVIAARNEWTAKSEEERNFWHPLANAAGIAAISVFIMSSLYTPSPAQAAPVQGFAERQCVLCKILKQIL